MLGQKADSNLDFPELDEMIKRFQDPKEADKLMMIEKELDMVFYDMLRDLRGGFTATYWHQLGKLNGYDLKEGYIVGDDEILDLVLQDFDISYDLDPATLDLKIED